MTKLILGEAHDILKMIPLEQLKMFVKIRHDHEIWDSLQRFCLDQKQIKMDQIYRLRRPKNNDDMVRNAVEHEYYAARIAALVVLLQLAENASDEIERRERRAK